MIIRQDKTRQDKAAVVDFYAFLEYSKNPSILLMDFFAHSISVGGVA
ncbi:hypothetical protein [Lactococcus garvieae]|nr:hypothetical protein [Lactococcus garvieae]MDG6191587.1 hypothetical protein [Lactococcus garvieae]PCS00063.1 hypothetical protein RU85_GL000970 [Lactococcus garvieae]QPR49800.1 hypothetical protein I6G86_05190 [Lactococcus garvieae]